MKPIAFIMAVLVLALSCLPCADDVDMNSEVFKTEISQTNQSDDDHEDVCSPFCQCACCAGFSLTHSLGNFSIKSPSYQTSYSSLYILLIFDVSLPIWQPPQSV